MHRLSHWSLGLLLIAATVAPAWAGSQPPVTDGDKAAIQRVVEGQMAAFQKDDGAAAFAFATPALRQRFRTPSNFMSMVRESYAPVYRPNQMSFGKLEQSDDAVIQHVLVVASDGVVREALYFMERQKDGTWLIGGCLLMTTDLKSS